MAINKKPLNTELTTGFGERSNQNAGRFYRKDGKANVIRKGIKFLDQFSWYHTMLALPRWKFWLWLLAGYVFINSLFGLVYFLVGIENLSGVVKGSPWQNFIEAFFFSTQTFSTVGYGHVSPSGIATSAIASFEAFLGVLSFALASGLFYGRFSKPRSFLKFSTIALIAPYKNGTALMFRTAPYKNNQLLEAEVQVTIAMKVDRNGDIRNEFYNLKVEISKITALVLNWTIVHHINENSPLFGMTLKELSDAQAEVLVYLKAFDEGFANTVVARTSYTANEIIEGARFKPMYQPSREGEATILHINRLNDFERVNIDRLRPVLSE